jgi:hypothetical protein
VYVADEVAYFPLTLQGSQMSSISLELERTWQLT